MLLRSLSAATAETTVGGVINKNTISDLFKISSSLPHLTQTHAQIITHGFQNDIRLLTKLTQRLSELGAIHYARDLVLSVHNPDVFLFNVLMGGFSNNGSPRSSLSLFSHLRKSTDLVPNSSTYTYAISAASGARDERAGRAVHGQAVVDGFDSELRLGSNIVNMYFMFSRVDDARKVFDRMPERDSVLWNTMLSGYGENEMYEESVQVFRDLINESSTRFDATTLLSVLPAVAELQELRLGMVIHSLARKTGCYSHDFVRTGFISLYSKCGKTEVLSTLFRDFCRPDVVAYNAMIHGYTSNGETERSLSLFKELVLSGTRLNSSTVVSLIPVSGHLMLVYAIHCYSLKSGFLSHESVPTALTTVYSKLNEMESARKVFNESPHKSLASWNAMISGYTQNGLTEDAISLFREMQKSEFSPNPITITCILSACAQLGTLSLGKWVHGLVRGTDFESSIYVSTALIGMYAKCGSIAEARRLFDLMPKRNEVTWNTMISGYGLHGHGHDALSIFSEMLNSGVAPTPVTFLCGLYACSHAGLVKEGEEMFNSMVHRYGFEPSMQSLVKEFMDRDPKTHPKASVAKLVDGYLAEKSRDSNLLLQNFISLAETVSSFPRQSHDGLYRAIDMFLKEHPGIGKSEKKRVCGLMDCRKLSAEACEHAVQNERLPMRVIVQVLFFEQIRVNGSSTGYSTPELTTTTLNTEDDEWDHVKEY